MKDKDKDKVEELFRSKLYDFEVDTMPDDWEAIVNRLPAKAPVPLYHTLRYWVAAAVAVLLVISGGLYLADRNTIPAPVAQEIEQQTEQLEQLAAKVTDDTDKKEPAGQPAVKMEKVHRPVAAVFRSVSKGKETVSQPEQRMSKLQEENVQSAEDIRQTEKVANEEATTLSFEQEEQTVADVKSSTKTSQSVRSGKQKKSRKWGFGMGAGGLSVGADNMVPQYVTNSTSLRGESLMLMNAASFNGELPKTDIHHKTPISVGLSVSRYLNNRFSLQTGLTYSFLSSEWTTNGDYHGKTKQKLHFVGIPLSLSYKIAEWNRFNFYTSAGVMAEVNVAGTLSAQLFNEDEEMVRASERIRMKKLLWSVNARGGVSYPLIRFVSAFAEVGAAYYFDNGSSIETIHSEKPFNVSLQLGFRLGF